jgi:AAA15 family ATPase/GTPase
MSHIKNIEIKNFKSIRHAKIEDCRRVNVFIGYPNVGKSNLLEAMSLMSYWGNEYKTSLKFNCRFKDLIDLFNDGDRDKDAEVFWENFVFSLRYIDKNKLDFSVADRLSYIERYNSSSTNIFKTDNINKEGQVGGLVLRDNTQFKESDLIVRKYQFKEDRIDTPYSRNNPKVLSSPYGFNLSEVIRYNAGLRKECGELFSTYNLKLFFDEENIMFIQKQLDDFSAFKISMNQVADTLQRLIFHKAAIVTNLNTVLLFEEPEAHMYPPYISKFTKDVICDESNNQFFITTHSPFVLNDFLEQLKPEDLAIYLVSYEKVTGATLINKMSDDDMHEAAQFGYDFFLNLRNFIPEH